MVVYMNGISAEGKRLTSFHGVVGAGGLGLLVRGALSVPGVDHVWLVTWKDADKPEEMKSYDIEKDFSWRRRW